jgi:integrase
VRREQHEALFVLLATSGLRIGEALGLCWDDVDFETRTVRVRRSVSQISGKVAFEHPKTTRSRRTIPLTDSAVAALQRHRAEYEKSGPKTDHKSEGYKEAKLPSDLVFCNGRGHAHLREHIRREFVPLLEKAKLPMVTLYSLRHAAATASLAAGVEVKTLQTLMGHTRPGVLLQHYLHSDAKAQRDAADRLERALRPNQEKPTDS